MHIYRLKLAAGVLDIYNFSTDTRLSFLTVGVYNKPRSDHPGNSVKLINRRRRFLYNSAEL